MTEAVFDYGRLPVKWWHFSGNIVVRSYCAIAENAGIGALMPDGRIWRDGRQVATFDWATGRCASV